MHNIFKGHLMNNPVFRIILLLTIVNCNPVGDNPPWIVINLDEPIPGVFEEALPGVPYNFGDDGMYLFRGENHRCFYMRQSILRELLRDHREEIISLRAQSGRTCNIARSLFVDIFGEPNANGSTVMPDMTAKLKKWTSIMASIGDTNGYDEEDYVVMVNTLVEGYAENPPPFFYFGNTEISIPHYLQLALDAGVRLKDMVWDKVHWKAAKRLFQQSRVFKKYSDISEYEDDCCSKCGKETNLQCSNCGTSYCSSEEQQADFLRHRLFCTT